MDVGAVWSAPVVSPVKEQEGEKARRQRQREGPMPSISATLTSLTVVTLSERSSIKHMHIALPAAGLASMGVAAVRICSPCWHAVESSGCGPIDLEAV